jgi:Zn-dependent peptidase ImmA (M78 family)
VSVPAPIRRQLLAHPALAPDDQPTLERFLALCERYAQLEQTVLGDLAFDLPVHGVAVERGDHASLATDAEALADVVRELLSLELPVTALGHALEAHGARIFRMPLERGTLGAFFFAGETAPAFLVNARLAPRATPIALAHLYAHFLVDVDPYEPTVCGAAREGGRTSWSEGFADAFAGALLAPRSAMEPFLDASDETEPPVDAIASYLDLPVSFVRRRLGDLGVVGVELDATDADWWDGAEDVVYPERFVALALEGIHEDVLDVDEFASWLELEREAALSLLALSAAPEEVAEGGAEGSEDGDTEGPSGGGASPS